MKYMPAFNINLVDWLREVSPTIKITVGAALVWESPLLGFLLITYGWLPDLRLAAQIIFVWGLIGFAGAWRRMGVVTIRMRAVRRFAVIGWGALFLVGAGLLADTLAWVPQVGLRSLDTSAANADALSWLLLSGVLILTFYPIVVAVRAWSKVNLKV